MLNEHRARATVELHTREYDQEQAALRLEMLLEDVSKRLELEDKGRRLVWRRRNER